MSVASDESPKSVILDGSYGQEFHAFLARLPRILGLLESMSISQQRLEAKLDGISSGLFEGRPEGSAVCKPMWSGGTSGLGEGSASQVLRSQLTRPRHSVPGRKNSPGVYRSAGDAHDCPDVGNSVEEDDAVDPTPHRLGIALARTVTRSNGTNRASIAAATDWEIAGEDDPGSPDEQASEGSYHQAFMLPENWPASLAPRNKNETLSSRSFLQQGGLSGRTAVVRNSNLLDRLNSKRVHTMEKKRARLCPDFCNSTALMLIPTSRLLVAWSVLGAIMLMFDLTTIPYGLAWDVPYNKGALFWLTLVSILVWSMDILVTFRTGFYDKAELILQPSKVAVSYLKSWFLVDFFVVCCDWVALLLSAADGSGENLRLARLGKVGRLLRIVGLLRVYRFTQVVEKSFKIKEYMLTFRVLQLVFYVLLFNHVMSCAWYAIGTTAPTDTGNRWVEEHNFSSGQPLYEYLSALHWTVAQFTLGSMDINCTNSAERGFSIFFLILGLIISTVIISSLSAAAVDFQISRAEVVKNVNQMTQFFRENDIDRKVTQQVHEQVKERLQKQETLLYNDVEAFKILSMGVRRDLQFELCKRHFKSHGLFRLWGHLDQAVAREICDTATTYQLIRRMDDLFLPGTLAKSAYHLVSGTLRYTQTPESAPVVEERVTVVPEGKWISEAAVSQWIHVGEAHATTECQLLLLNGDALAQALHAGFVARQVTLEYSRQFYRNLIAACPPKRQWPNDLYVPFTDYGTLVWCMAPDVQVAIGVDAIDDVYGIRRFKTLRQWLEGMVQEVHDGTSVVVVSPRGELERLVSVVTLNLKDGSGNTLIHVATLEENGSVRPHVYLPGMKLGNGEQPEEGLKRLIELRLPLLEGQWSLLRTEREIEIRKSPRYGVHTKYLKTVFHARLTGRFEYESTRSRGPSGYRPTTWSREPNGALSASAPATPLPEEGRRSSVGTESPSSGGSVPHRTSEGMHSALAVTYQRTTISFAYPRSRVGEELNFDAYVIPMVTGVTDKHGLYGWLSEAELGALKKMSDSTMRSWIQQAVRQRRLSSSSQQAQGQQGQGQNGWLWR